MRKLNLNQMVNLNGGICQSFPNGANPGQCWPQPCWAGTAFGLVGYLPTEVACPA